jgi:ABC-type nitrate/sulfonate/bicarbonate transport system ATPase subunit
MMALADRVVVGAARPGRINEIVTIDRPRPRYARPEDRLCGCLEAPALAKAGDAQC